MTIATNPTTGEVVYLTDAGAWEKATTAINPQTKEIVAFDGKAWSAVPAMPQVGNAADLVGASTPVDHGMSLTDMAKGAVVNAPASAAQFASDIVQPIVHPLDTAEAIKNLGAGVLQKVGILSGDDQVKYADAVGQFFKDRYGSTEGVKNAIATDPVGVLSDVATVLTGGGGLAAKAPGLIGKAGELVKAAGSMVDPVNAAGRAVKLAGRAGAEVLGGVGTHTGAQPIIEAAKAGAEGGQRAKDFTDAMRGNAPIGEVVTEAKAALQNIRNERGSAYRTAMQEIGQDSTVLDFSKIDSAVTATQNVKNFKGQDLSPTTKAIRSEINDTIAAWKKLNPAEFHTAEGLDALKQKIGDIRDGAKYGTPEREIASAAYGAVRQTIVDQAPEYAKIMKGYEEASALVQDIEKTLSLNPKASVDTTVRKLQSALRNNVNSDFGKRGELADYLVQAGARNLLTKLAGQSLNAWAPRGMGKLVAGGAGLLGLGGHLTPAAAAGLAAASSPRIVGEAAFKAGQAARFASPAARSSFQIGRASRLQPQ